MCYVHSKVPFYFFSRDKFVFPHFSGKIKWVCKKAVLFFFRDWKKNKTGFPTSEWVKFKLFLGKKKQIKQKTCDVKKKNALKLFTSKIYERKLRRVEVFPWWITLLYRIYKEYTILYNVTGKCCPVEPKSNMIFLNKKWRVSKILSEWLINFSWEKK